MNKLYIADVGSFSYKGRSTGHYIPLAQNYIDVLSNNFDVVVAGGPCYQEAFKEDRLLKLPYDNPGNSWRDKVHLFKNCIKLFSAAEGEIIVLQQSSITTAFIGIGLFYKRRSKLYVIEYSSSSINSPIKKFLYKLAKDKIDGILCPNEEVGKAFERPYCVVPDYIYAESENIEAIPFEEKKYDLCIIGRLVPEKGVVEVARKFANTSVKVLIAGRPQNQELENQLKEACQKAENIKLHLGFIEREEYERYLQESRYAILNYQGEYSIRSSGVVFDTLFSGVPVIGKICKALNFIGQTNCGFLYKDLNDIDLKHVFNKDVYEDYIKNIESYKSTHKLIKVKLVKFLQNE